MSAAQFCWLVALDKIKDLTTTIERCAEFMDYVQDCLEKVAHRNSNIGTKLVADFRDAQEYYDLSDLGSLVTTLRRCTIPSLSPDEDDLSPMPQDTRLVLDFCTSKCPETNKRLCPTQASTSTFKRPRGRPPKNPCPTTQASTSTFKRPRGRPPKIAARASL